jgi:lysophospholipase L1-like esterase
MDRRLRTSALTTVIACAVLAAIGRSEPKASYLEPGLSPYQRIVRMMHDRNLNKNASEEDIAGYYEGLLAGRPVQMLERSRQSEQWRFRGDFLYYEARPNLDIADYNENAGLRHITNSHGMPDVEYTVGKAPGTRRIAVLGDSITRGKGTPFGHTFEALLEQYLNQPGGAAKYEVLNFSDNGYRLTQLVDVALEKAPRFAPDVYLVCLTQLAVNRKWGDHLAQLVWDGIDLKYPFLRDLAASARLDPRDPPATMDAKLAAQRLPAIRWAMTTIRERASSHGASVVAVLVPAANDTQRQAEVFAGPREVLRELGIPIIDLLDTFDGVREFSEFRVVEGDVHPNQEGHQRIFENLARKLREDRDLTALVLGPPAEGAATGAVQP